MARIFKFTPKQRSATSLGEVRRRGGAEIVIFPGVRYERKGAAGREESGDPDGPRNTPRRSRKINGP